MQERFAADPNSVAPEWRDFFATNPPSDSAEPAPEPPPAVEPLAGPATSTPAAQRAELVEAAPATVTPETAPPVIATVEPREERTEAPSTPGDASGLGADIPDPRVVPDAQDATPTHIKLRGVALKTAQNMDASLVVPTATSFREVPMKLAIDQRGTINNFLRRSRGGKLSFTHLIAYAMVQAIKDVPEMNTTYSADGSAPSMVRHNSINVGIAIDSNAKDGTRQLLVPVIKGCERLNFAQFFSAYEDIVERTHNQTLTVDDYAGATCSITNPGGIGTNASRPRLMPGQAFILGVGAITYPAPFQGASAQTLAEMGISKVTTLTSTYDHRVIQGAQSGEFLARIHELLLGEDGFYDEVFESLRVPYPPLRWDIDITPVSTDVDKQARVYGLIESYRQFGHLMADTDPLEYRQRTHPDLELASHGLSLWDLDRSFPVWSLGEIKQQSLTLREIVDRLRDSYCHTLGVEYMHIQDPEQRRWWQDRLEGAHTPRPGVEQLRILDELSEAEVFETFLQTKYVGQTRFSLEGAESAIVALSEICECAADEGLVEVCIGMPHRGRLNVLTNIAGKAYSQVFREFDNRAPNIEDISGDVKYHLGAEGSYQTPAGNTIRVSVAANPSHLEAVDPVLEGIARAKSDRTGDPVAHTVLPVLMHGDAAFAGQGIVYETLQMSQLRAYRNGGTIHIVVNNQVGFTTGPMEGRSSVYCTDVAKTVQAPVLHVNGDDPDACSRASQLAFDYRQAFKKDVVIDLICYRRRGHNEGDDPSFTQPQMYDLIEQKRPVRELFAEALVGRGDITSEDADAAVARFRARLDQVFSEVRNPDTAQHDTDEYRIAPRYPTKQRAKAAPAITREMMDTIASVYENLPSNFQVHPKVAPQLARRVEAIRKGPIDWATAELLAFGSLLLEKHQVRLVGQDSRRGTYSQRFGAVVDRSTNEAWVPLKHLSNDQAPFDIYDSILNEYAAMGFEYGYSVAAPDALVCWEGQYGDFSNGAQTIIDEFVVSGHTKWAQQSGVTILLPHGYEGQGPDHSSARLERWLQMAHDENIGVAQPSTPASYFHLLRTHALVTWHHPIVVATPKSMLRHKMATSMPDEFIAGAWRPALPDDSITDASGVERILLCSGKIRWDLVAERERRGLNGKVAIISLERLFPLPDEGLAKTLARFPHVTDVRWVQDEPENQGGWHFLERNLPPAMEQWLARPFTFDCVAREASEVPSVGSKAVHTLQQDRLMQAALG
jgi:2-oxoglutarate dehydrogenase E1 component